MVAGLAALASLSIGATYVATEPERVDIQIDSHAVIDMFNQATRMSGAIRDQELAVDDYLLSRNPAARERYEAAVRAELLLSEDIRRQQPEDFPGVKAAAARITEQTEMWRTQFAQPAVSAVDRNSSLEISAIFEAAAKDQGPSIASINDLITELDAAQADIATREDNLASIRALAGAFGIAVMLLGAIASVVLIRRWVVRPLDSLLATATEVEAGKDSRFVAERDDEIGRLGQALERMRLALSGDAETSAVLNRFTEVTTFAADDTDVARSNLEALDLLVHPDAAVTHVLNRSKDRAIPEATLGSAMAEILPLNTLSHCPGIVRGSIYVTPDAAQPLSVHCPVYPTKSGTLACVPLAHGEVVGSVHMVWEKTNAFPLELRANVARIAEHAALAIANRRLLAALRGMASTDARTGLANTRAFDQAVEDALAARTADERIAVLMLDLDHFKDFNDRYGHPSGDEALRAFADILRSCVREGDVAARYGGEEFAVMLITDRRRHCPGDRRTNPEPHRIDRDLPGAGHFRPDQRVDRRLIRSERGAGSRQPAPAGRRGALSSEGGRTQSCRACRFAETGGCRSAQAQGQLTANRPTLGQRLNSSSVSTRAKIRV